MPRLIWECDCVKEYAAPCFHAITDESCKECGNVRPDLKDLRERVCQHEWVHEGYIEPHGDGHEWDECKKCHMHKPGSFH